MSSNQNSITPAGYPTLPPLTSPSQNSVTPTGYPKLPPLAPPPSIPTSVPDATPVATIAPVGRDMAREASSIEGLGMTAQELATISPRLLFEKTYTPEELKGIEDYQSLLQYEQSKNDLLATPKPTNTMLATLEKALRAKSNPADTPIGPSQLYGQAGIPTTGVSGYTTLMQSLQNQSEYAASKYRSFSDTLAQTAGAMKDTYNAVAEKYSILKADYDRQAQNLQEVTMQMMRNEQAMDLLNAQYDLDIKAKQWAIENPSPSEKLAQDKWAIEKQQAEMQSKLMASMTDIVDRYKGGEFGSGEEFINELNALNELAYSITGENPLDMDAFEGFMTEAVKLSMTKLPKVGAATENAMGTGVVTGYGSPLWKWGLDYVVQGGMGAPVVTPIGGVVIGAEDGHVKGEKKSFGNRVMIQLDDGSVIQLSHLSSIAVKKGDRVEAGQVVGEQGNTGSVLGITGIHVDITMKNKDGDYMTPQEVQGYLMAVGSASAQSQNKFTSSPDWFKKYVEEDYMNSTEADIEQRINGDTNLSDAQKKEYVALFRDIINQPIRKSGLGVGAASFLRQLRGVATGNIYAIPRLYEEIMKFAGGDYVGFVDSDETWKDRKIRLLADAKTQEKVKADQAEEKEALKLVLADTAFLQEINKKHKNDKTRADKVRAIIDNVKANYNINLSNYQIELLYKTIFSN